MSTVIKKADYLKTCCFSHGGPVLLSIDILFSTRTLISLDCNVLAGPVSLVTGIYFTKDSTRKTRIQRHDPAL